MESIIIPQDKVLAEQAATDSSPLTNGKPYEVQGITHVMISPEYATESGASETDLEWFRCTHAGCGKAFAKVRSAITHRTQHSPRRKVRKLEAEKAASTERRSAGVTAGAVARRARLDAIKMQKPQDILREAADGLSKIAQQLRDVANIYDVPEQLISAEELAALREKADKMDQFRAFLK